MTTKDIENLTKAAEKGKIARKKIREAIDNFASWACDNLIEGAEYGNLKVVRVRSNVGSAPFLRIHRYMRSSVFAEVGEGKYLHGDFTCELRGISDNELRGVAETILEELKTLRQRIEEKAEKDANIAKNIAAFA